MWRGAGAEHKKMDVDFFFSQLNWDRWNKGPGSFECGVLL